MTRPENEQTTKRSIFCSGDPADIIDTIHTVSMDQDPIVASYGRFLKSLYPALDNWVSEERQRRDAVYEDISLAFVNGIGQLVQFYTLSVCKRGRAGSLIKLIVEGIHASLEDHTLACREMDLDLNSEGDRTLQDLIARLRAEIENQNQTQQQEQSHE